jgi:hypothetical protein
MLPRVGVGMAESVPATAWRICSSGLGVRGPQAASKNIGISRAVISFALMGSSLVFRV